MTADPRLLVKLSELPGIDPAGLIGRRFGPYLTTGQFEEVVYVVRWSGLGASDECDVVRMGALYRCVSGLSIDLSDAATRDRCLRWLAGRMGLAVGCGAPMWEAHVDHGWGPKSTDGWHLSTSMWEDGAEYDAPAWLASALGIDPRDDTRLPDGSRIVDALALAAVLRHVGGAA